MLLPMMGVTMGAMLGGSAVIETVFSIKGIGYMMVQGIMARDYVLMQGYIIWITLVFIVINIIIDVLSVWLNPKRRAAIKEALMNRQKALYFIRYVGISSSVDRIFSYALPI